MNRSVLASLLIVLALMSGALAQGIYVESSRLWYKKLEGEWMSPDGLSALLDAVNRSE
jgi:hypothetical protein